LADAQTARVLAALPDTPFGGIVAPLLDVVEVDPKNARRSRSTYFVHNSRFVTGLSDDGGRASVQVAVKVAGS
jgi:hypothetical protein